MKSIMKSFDYKTHAVKVIFGTPLLEAITKELPEGETNIAFIASKRNADLKEKVEALDGVGEVYHFDNIIQHVPKTLVEEAENFFKGKKIDIILCLGGGSAIGLGKALVLSVPAALWAVPSTYSGSEMTNIYGISDHGVKTVKREDRVHPAKVFYDPDLSLGMPLSLAVPSAFNAMAHLVEAMYAPDKNPIIESLTVMGLESLYDGLIELNIERKLTKSINEKLFFGAYVGGKVLCEVSMGLHHKAAHVLGGNFNLEHSHVHTLLLPYVLEYQWDYLDIKAKYNFIQVFQDKLPFNKIRKLQEDLGTSFNLEGLGMKKEDLSKAVAYMLQMTYPNPAPLEKEKLVLMLEKAF
jgi:maleylacetate reductase